MVFYYETDEVYPVDTEKYVQKPTNDLTGLRFGKLTVLEYALYKSSGGDRLWRCRCDCGTECLLTASALKKRGSCGGYQHPKVDVSGQTFGHLTAVRPTEERRGASVVWECTCDCGNTIRRSLEHLRRRQHVEQHCGCRLSDICRRALYKGHHFIDGTCIENIRSDKLHTTNTSGLRGVRWDKNAGKWRAYIYFKGKQHELGLYLTLDATAEIRKSAEDTYFQPVLEAFNAEVC